MSAIATSGELEFQTQTHTPPANSHHTTHPSRFRAPPRPPTRQLEEDRPRPDHWLIKKEEEDGFPLPIFELNLFQHVASLDSYLHTKNL